MVGIKPKKIRSLDDLEEGNELVIVDGDLRLTEAEGNRFQGKMMYIGNGIRMADKHRVYSFLARIREKVVIVRFDIPTKKPDIPTKDNGLRGVLINGKIEQPINSAYDFSTLVYHFHPHYGTYNNILNRVDIKWANE